MGPWVLQGIWLSVCVFRETGATPKPLQAAFCIIGLGLPGLEAMLLAASSHISRCPDQLGLGFRV